MIGAPRFTVLYIQLLSHYQILELKYYLSYVVRLRLVDINSMLELRNFTLQCCQLTERLTHSKLMSHNYYHSSIYILKLRTQDFGLTYVSPALPFHGPLAHFELIQQNYYHSSIFIKASNFVCCCTFSLRYKLKYLKFKISRQYSHLTTSHFIILWTACCIVQDQTLSFFHTSAF